MARFSSVNQSVLTGAAAIYQLKTLLVLAGWAVLSSSDGTTYSAGGDVITTASSLANTNAWVRLRDPGGRREFVLQRTTGNTLWRVKFSELAGFVSGSPGATRVPAATDEGVIFGSGTDASPTGASLFPTDGTYRFHTIAFSDPVETNVYSFFAFSSDSQTQATPGRVQMRFFVDGLTTPSGSDASPVGIVIFNQTAAFAANSAALLASGSTAFWAWYKYGIAGAAFQNWNWFGALGYTSGVVYPVSASTGSVFTPEFRGGKEGILKNLWGFGRVSGASNPQVKGTFIRMALPLNAEKLYPYVFDSAGTPLIYLDGTMLIPWEVGTAGSY